MSNNENTKLISSLLFEKFQKVVLLPKEAAAILGRSEEALKKDRAEATGIPFTRLNNKPSGKPLYSITAIAKHLVENEIKTI